MLMSRAKLYDLAAALPLIGWYGLAIAGLVPEIRSELASLDGRFDAVPCATLLSQIATLAFMALMIAIFVARRLPVAKAQGIAPRAVAVIASNLEIAIAALPHARLSPFWSLTAAVLTIAGLAGAVFILAWLGRNFSILPQARGLVTSGPYRHIRHPLYLAEAIGGIGIMLQYLQPWALLITLTGFAFQIARMGYEERILADAFGEYRAYIARTARLIPGVW